MQVYILLVLAWETYYSCIVLVKPLCSNAETQFQPRRGNHIWTIFWCWATVLMRNWHWRSYLGIGLSNLSKSQFFDCKAPLRCVLTEKEPLAFRQNMKHSLRNWVSSSNFAHSAAAKPRPSAENFGIKESLSPLSQPFFTTTNPIVWKGVSSVLLCFICTIISYPYFAER